MTSAAKSFCLSWDDPAAMGDGRAFSAEIRGLLAEVQPAAAIVVFASGLSQAALATLAHQYAALRPGVAAVFVGGTAVFTEAGPPRSATTVAGLAFRGEPAHAWSLTESTADAQQRGLRRAIPDARRPSDLALMFCEPGGFDAGLLELLRHEKLPPCILGAGIAAQPEVLLVTEESAVQAGPTGLLVVPGGAKALSLVSSPACRLLLPPRPITRGRAGLVSEIAHQPALEVLELAGSSLDTQPLILALVSAAPKVEGRAPELLVYGIQGVDPARGAVFISPEVEPGMHIAFAVTDAAAAHVDLERRVSELSRDVQGSLPRCGLYFTSPARAVNPYGSLEADCRTLQARFPDLPWLGMVGSFALAPHAGLPAVHSHAGVFALFTSPS
jgi:small ligand-binding sensory domain FIST